MRWIQIHEPLSKVDKAVRSKLPNLSWDLLETCGNRWCENKWCLSQIFDRLDSPYQLNLCRYRNDAPLNLREAHSAKGSRASSEFHSVIRQKMSRQEYKAFNYKVISGNRLLRSTFHWHNFSCFHCLPLNNRNELKLNFVFELNSPATKKSLICREKIP